MKTLVHEFGDIVIVSSIPEPGSTDLESVEKGLTRSTYWEVPIYISKH